MFEAMVSLYVCDIHQPGLRGGTMRSQSRLFSEAAIRLRTIFEQIGQFNFLGYIRSWGELKFLQHVPDLIFGLVCGQECVEVLRFEHEGEDRMLALAPIEVFSI